MTYSFTTTTTSTFTRTSARYIASKVVADLRRLRSYYGQPSEEQIELFYGELIELLALGYVRSIEYGFKRDGRRLISLLYEVRSDGSLTDDRAGGVHARADITGASWFSFLIHNSKWWSLSPEHRARIEAGLPISRTPAEAPQDGQGYWSLSHTYSAKRLLDVQGTLRFLASVKVNGVPTVGSPIGQRLVDADVGRAVPVQFLPPPRLSAATLQNEVRWVDTSVVLEAVVQELRRADVLGLDVETTLDFDTLCLMQIATRERTYLIDPFATDLKPLLDVLSKLGNPPALPGDSQSLTVPGKYESLLP